jgi:hypothetical protein
MVCIVADVVPTYLTALRTSRMANGEWRLATRDPGLATGDWRLAKNLIIVYSVAVQARITPQLFTRQLALYQHQHGTLPLCPIFSRSLLSHVPRRNSERFHLPSTHLFFNQITNHEASDSTEFRRNERPHRCGQYDEMRWQWCCV